MKKKITAALCTITTISILFLSCSKDENSNSSDTDFTNLGTFNGNIQVADDPQTQLGYIYNAKVTVFIKNSEVKVKLVGDLNVDREYTGTIVTNNNSYLYVNINKQTKPTVKNATESLVINNNELNLLLGVINDSEKVKTSTTPSTTITIAGKIQMIGSGLIKE